MITLDLRNAIARAATGAGAEAGATADPMLRPGGPPGTYATSLPFALSTERPRPIAQALATRLNGEPWIAEAMVTGDGYVTVRVTPEALASVAARIIAAGPGCARSDVLRGVTVPDAPPADLRSAPTWESARAMLAAELTARLTAAAGANVNPDAGGAGPQARRPRSPRPSSKPGRDEPAAGEVAAAIAFAGADAVRLALARVVPGRSARVDSGDIARHVLENPAYAVRYAHARAASGVRWAAALGAGTPAGAGAPPREEAALPCLPADPADLALLDALSWLPERVAIAARRGRPDEFARYLEGLAGATIAAVRFIRPQDNRRLAVARDLAAAAQTGLAAGLGLLGVSAADRL